MKIKLEDINDVNCFVQGCEYYDGVVDAKQGRRLVNAKSFLTMCSLDLTEPIEVIIDTKIKGISEDFYNFIKKWEVA